MDERRKKQKTSKNVSAESHQDSKKPFTVF